MKRYYPVRRIKHRLGFYKRRKNKKRKYLPVVIWLMAVAIFVIFIILITESRLAPLAVRLAETKYETELYSECNLIVGQKLKEADFSDAFRHTKNENGEISASVADFAKINELKSEISVEICEMIKNKRSIAVNVPIGTMLSDGMLSGFGFEVPVFVVVSAFPSVDIKDSFDSAGINSTRHRFCVSIKVDAQIHTNSTFTEKNLEIEIPIAEEITSGDVPNFIYGKN